MELTEEGTKLAAITRAIFGLVEEAQTLLEAKVMTKSTYRI